ncbi:MAG: ABC transporter substrate-binding protein [Proteobacteria bacterium]|nr:ABC transporter substrate-binding protein [Pseudomonadota bacterium]
MKAAAIGILSIMGASGASAQDKVKVGMLPVSSALPFYVAQDMGYFAAEKIEAEGVTIPSIALLIQALVTNEADVIANLSTGDGTNINSRRPNTVTYISLNGQSAKYLTDQFIVRADVKAESLKDLKGARIASVPGAGSLAAARESLKANGLKEGDYALSEQQLPQHMALLKAGTFEAAFTFEPFATMAVQAGVARRLEGGVIAHYLLGSPDKLAFGAGGGLNGSFIQKRPDVARRFAAAWYKALDLIDKEPEKVRPLLTKYLSTPADIAGIVPLVKFLPVPKMTSENIADFQALVDFNVKIGLVPAAFDVKTELRGY